MGTPIGGAMGPPAGWVPPTDVERHLLAAKSRGDWDGYVRALLGADTFGYRLKEKVDAKKLTAGWLRHQAPDGREYFAVYTRGELLPRRPDAVACEISLPVPPEEWWGTELSGLMINPGSPTEALFTEPQKLRRHWKALKKDVPKRGHDDDALLTKYTGPLHGPLAHGLACGAHLAVHRRDLWNDVGDVCSDYREDARVLKADWGTTDRATWVQQLTILLQGYNSPPQPEFALKARKELAERYPGAHRDPRNWHQVIADTLRQRGAGEEEIAKAVAVTGPITEYEERLRADGVLPPDGFVTSALAYDYGRAVNYARWGVGARFGEQAEAENAIAQVGELARRAYTSWEDFSVGYIVGRALRFDKGAFKHMYTSAVTPHRILTTDPASPWRNIPFAPLT